MGFNIGIYRVRTAIKQLQPVAKQPKQHRYPIGGKASVIAPNYLNRQFNPTKHFAHYKKRITGIRWILAFISLIIFILTFIIDYDFTPSSS